VAPEAENPYIGDEYRKATLTVPVSRLDERDTAGVLALCERARAAAKPERDQVISQIFALRLHRCRPQALDAIELLIYDVIVDEGA
jgi:hypothetical protein